MEVVGRLGEGQEEDPTLHHRHPHPEGEWPERVRHHRGLPREEGGAIDDARTPAICDGARNIVRWNDARRGNTPQYEITQHIKETMEPLRVNAGAALDFVYPVPGHPSMWPEPGYVVLVSFPFSCFLFN